MRNRIRCGVGALLMLALACGCGGAMKSGEMSPAPVAAPEAPPPPPPPPGAAMESGATTTAGFAGDRPRREEFRAGMAGKAAPPPPPVPKPKPGDPNPPPDAVQRQQSIVIYSAELHMAVFEVETSMKRIEEIAKTSGGFLAKREDRTIVIRIPAERFDEIVRAIEKVGDVLHRNVVAEDVTEEFRDLEVRLHGSKAVQERLTQLLQRAQKVEESIAIERELDRVTMEIDRIEGRMKFLRDRAAFSTITVNFAPKASENVSQNPFKMPTPWLSQLGLARLFQL